MADFFFPFFFDRATSPRYTRRTFHCFCLNVSRATLVLNDHLTERNGCVTFEMNPRDSLRSPDFNRPTDLSPLAGLTLAGFPANYQNLSADVDFPRATDFNYPDEKRAGIVREIRMDGKNGV